MACESFLDNFFRISGMFLWAILLVVLFIIFQQKEQIKAAYKTKKAVQKMMRPPK